MSSVWNAWQQPAGGAAVGDVDYEEWTKEQLQEELERRGLPKPGNKPELIERLQEDD